LYKIDLLQPQDSSTFGLTRLLKAWSGGDAQALERLTPAVYAELRSLAQIHLAGERQGHLLQPTALVNEAFLRLIRGEPVEWNNRTHFFAVSASAVAASRTSRSPVLALRPRRRRSISSIWIRR
jgi:hypothetical protein